MADCARVRDCEHSCLILICVRECFAFDSGILFCFSQKRYIRLRRTDPDFSSGERPTKEKHETLKRKARKVSSLKTSDFEFFSPSLRLCVKKLCSVKRIRNVVFEREECAVKLETSPKERNYEYGGDEFGPKDEPFGVVEIDAHQTVEVAQIFHHGFHIEQVADGNEHVHNWAFGEEHE